MSRTFLVAAIPFAMAGSLPSTAWPSEIAPAAVGATARTATATRARRPKARRAAGKSRSRPAASRRVLALLCAHVREAPGWCRPR
jgi:hypothetical protein